MIEPRCKNKKKVRRSKLILLELNHNNELCVILFRNKRWNNFVTLGGRVDKLDINFESALIREVKEESFNLIDISDIINIPNRIKYIDFQDNNNNEIVRVYFLLINNELFDDKIYKTNKDILKNTDKYVPKAWKELDDYDKFPIKNILNSYDYRNNEYSKCYTINDEQKSVYIPIIDYINEASRLNIIDDLLKTYSIVKDYVLTNDVSDTFLNGTSTIKIKN